MYTKKDPLYLLSYVWRVISSKKPAKGYRGRPIVRGAKWMRASMRSRRIGLHQNFQSFNPERKVNKATPHWYTHYGKSSANYRKKDLHLARTLVRDALLPASEPYYRFDACIDQKQNAKQGVILYHPDVTFETVDTWITKIASRYLVLISNQATTFLLNTLAYSKTVHVQSFITQQTAFACTTTLKRQGYNDLDPQK